MDGSPMDRRIDAHIARTQFGQIMDLATKNNERFIVDRRGEPGGRHHERAGTSSARSHCHPTGSRDSGGSGQAAAK
jgi:hypothetical protein